MKIHEHKTKRILNELGLGLGLVLMTRNMKLHNTKINETNELPADITHELAH